MSIIENNPNNPPQQIMHFGLTNHAKKGGRRRRSNITEQA